MKKGAEQSRLSEFQVVDVEGSFSDWGEGAQAKDTAFSPFKMSFEHALQVF
jgi:hypothetical protein